MLGPNGQLERSPVKLDWVFLRLQQWHTLCCYLDPQVGDSLVEVHCLHQQHCSFYCCVLE